MSHIEKCKLPCNYFCSTRAANSFHGEKKKCLHNIFRTATLVNMSYLRFIYCDALHCSCVIVSTWACYTHLNMEMSKAERRWWGRKHDILQDKATHFCQHHGSNNYDYLHRWGKRMFYGKIFHFKKDHLKPVKQTI